MSHRQDVTDLRIAVLTSDEVFELARYLESTRRGPVRVGIDVDGVKVDDGSGWSPPLGRLANEAGR